MGAKQSKRSVDISGKEAESAGEVAAAGAGGEGRVEQLADADALKPQLNGDAHIHEQTDKEKELDVGTPENEKDAATEKEGKQQEEEKEASPVTNGETEQKVENGDSTPTSDDGKKPKKEKVKKKWSLRSISFSRKDKPKQEKKQKEEEPKTNGEPEKVPEETAEVVPESTAEEATEEVKTEETKTEVKEEKAPETPVTEPITNGSSTPESLKTETPITEEPAASSPEIIRPEPKAETEPEQLPVNGLSLEEPIKEIPEVEKVEESKHEEPTTETTDIVPENPVKKEVCVDQMPLIEPTPPPLPANPPPSSVASFAATTMAPELTDASLANTADTAIPTLSTDSNTKDKIIDTPPEQKTVLPDIETATTELSCPLNEIKEENSVPVVPVDSKQVDIEVVSDSVNTEVPTPEKEIEIISSGNEIVEKIQECIESSEKSEVTEISKLTDDITNDNVEIPVKLDDIEVSNELSVESLKSSITTIEVPEPATDVADTTLVAEEPLPSPPPPICDDVDNVSANVAEVEIDKTSQETTQNTEHNAIHSNHISDVNETTTSDIVDDRNGELNLKNELTDTSSNVIIDTIECNGNIVDEDIISKKESLTEEILGDAAPKEKANVECERRAPSPDDSMPPPVLETNESVPAPDAAAASLAAPLPSDAAPAPPQDPLPTSDKIAELIPEIPTVPEITTETLQETTTDVAVAN